MTLRKSTFRLATFLSLVFIGPILKEKQPFQNLPRGNRSFASVGHVMNFGKHEKSSLLKKIVSTS